MKPYFVIILLLVFVSITSLFPELASSATKIRFQLAMVYQIKSGEIKPVDFSLPLTSLGQDDKIRIYFKPGRNVFMYIFDLDSEGGLQLLFPRSFDIFAEHTKSGIYGGGKGFYIPEEEVWFGFDNSGIEEFYIFASPKRLSQLETLTNNYLAVQKKGTDNVESSKQAVLDEIRRLKKEKSIFAGIVEKPVVVAGDWRGEEETIESFAMEIEAEGFYAKTIRIEH